MRLRPHREEKKKKPKVATGEKKQKLQKREKKQKFRLTSKTKAVHETKIKRVQVNVNFSVKVKCQGSSHLMGEASYPSFIGGAWSGAQ